MTAKVMAHGYILERQRQPEDTDFHTSGSEHDCCTMMQRIPWPPCDRGRRTIQKCSSKMLSMPAATFTFTPCLHGWYWHLVVVVLCTIYYFALCLSSLRHLFMYACIHICVHSVISIYLVVWSMNATVLGDCCFVRATVIDSHTCFCIHWLACIPALALSCIEI